eukprot:symbB.v1.2.035060.t1/scaffold4638.1/size37069/1
MRNLLSTGVDEVLAAAICSSCFDDFSRTLVAGQEGAQEVGKLVSVQGSQFV